MDFANDRVLLLDQVFTILSAGEIEEMLPDILKVHMLDNFTFFLIGSTSAHRAGCMVLSSQCML